MELYQKLSKHKLSRELYCMYKELHTIDLLERSNVLPYKDTFRDLKSDLWDDISSCQHELAKRFEVDFPNDLFELWSLDDSKPEMIKCSFRRFICEHYHKAKFEVIDRFKSAI